MVENSLFYFYQLETLKFEALLKPAQNHIQTELNFSLVKIQKVLISCTISCIDRKEIEKDMCNTVGGRQRYLAK